MIDPEATADQYDEFWTLLDERRHDIEALLRIIAERVVGLFGDGCVITTVGPDRTTLLPRAVVHAAPEVERAMRAVLASNVARVGEGIAGTAAADRRTIALNGLEPTTVAETTPRQFLPFVRDHPMRAIVVVPLLSGGELVGTLGSVRTSSDEPYSLEEITTLEGLAERAAHAIEEALAGPRTIGAADFEAIYRHSPDGLLLATPDGHILAANPAACAILRMTEREIIDRGREGLVDTTDSRLATALASRASAGRFRAELTMIRSDGSPFPVSVASALFTTPDHKVRATVMFRDISEEVAARELAASRIAELEQTTGHDLLTGLWNRAGFAIAAEHALATADRRNTSTQLALVDLDGLRQINDTYGHSAGDSAIVAVASAIGRSLRQADLACRSGGDEFLVLAADTSREGFDHLLDRISSELVSATDTPRPLTVSVGTAERAPRSMISLAELIDAADRDMYQRKVLRKLRES